MERARPKQTRKRTAGAVRLAMVLVDGREIRNKIKADYAKIQRDLEKARDEVESYQSQDSPAYSRWMNQHFGALLARLAETSAKLEHLDRFFRSMEAEILFGGLSKLEAYRRAVEQRDHPEPEEKDTNRSSRSQKAFDEEEAEKFRSFFDFDDLGQPAKAPAHRPAAGKRLKELYRALARQLHPDAQKEMTRQKKEWWHQAQEAYQLGDVEQLEVILSLCEMEDAGTKDKVSLSALQRITAQLKSSLRQLKGQLGKFRRDPAWHFTSRQDLGSLEAKVEKRLKHDLGKMQEEVQWMEAEVASMAEESKRQRSRRRRPQRQKISPDFFDIIFG